jgi:hypothetical protein
MKLPNIMLISWMKGILNYCDTNRGKKRNAYRILVGKPEGKRPLGRSRRTWVDNIKMDLRDI